MRVAILGTGAIGLGAAALLAEHGHAPVLWTRSGTAPPVQEVSGALAGRFAFAFEPDIARAVAGAEAVVLALPAHCYRAVLDAALPHLAEGRPVILSGHLPFAVLYLARRLAERGCGCRSSSGAHRHHRAAARAGGPPHRHASRQGRPGSAAGGLDRGGDGALRGALFGPPASSRGGT
jgi:hypothetical protein